MFESLEGRRLMSVSLPHRFVPGEYGPAAVNQVNSALTIGNAHDLQILEQGLGEIEVIDYSTGATPVSRLYTGVTTVVINGTRGADLINSGIYYVNLTINGGAGSDQIGVADNVTDGTGGSTVVHAGAGNDVISVSNTRFNSGTKVFGELGHDTYSGPAGIFAQ